MLLKMMKWWREYRLRRKGICPIHLVQRVEHFEWVSCHTPGHIGYDPCPLCPKDPKARD